ncbi:unnamed protein product, partial [Candidula unifasciata]
MLFRALVCPLTTNWQAWVFTSDIANAGTDANVYMVIYGDKGKSDDIPLQNKGNTFEKGQVDTFRFSTNDVGKPYKIRVWHDNSGTFAGWHLDKVKEGEVTFICNRWLAEDEDDGLIEREITATGAQMLSNVGQLQKVRIGHDGK